MKEIFVTYSWDSEEHNNIVLSFTDHLRKKGFSAEMDKFITQEQNSTDFSEMMHKAMTDYEKVIIVLSKGYKVKAENFKGGVGNEYSLIIKDIDENKNKYILVSFEEISNDITPLFFKNRHIFNLSKEKDLTELYAKLQNKKTIHFSEVGNKKPEIISHPIENFSINKEELIIEKIDFAILGSSQLYNKYKSIEFEPTLYIKNESNSIITDFSIQVFFPRYTIDTQSKNVANQDEYQIETIENDSKIYPSQSKSFKLSNFKIRNDNFKNVFDTNISVKLYTANGTVERKFIISETIKVKREYMVEYINEEMFLTNRH